MPVGIVRVSVRVCVFSACSVRTDSCKTKPELPFVVLFLITNDLCVLTHNRDHVTPPCGHYVCHFCHMWICMIVQCVHLCL